MKTNAWIMIYVVATLIFFGGYFSKVYLTPYFPIFVVFCMLYGVAVLLYWLKAKQVDD